MTQKDVAAEHQGAKKNSYWDNLVGGDTAAYKAKKIDELLVAHGPKKIDTIIDIGCGTCELIFHYQKKHSAKLLTCMDYDKKVIDALQAKYPTENVNWSVADVFQLGKSEQKYDLCFLLDMIHEVYSFYGRPNRNVEQPVDHKMGHEAVDRLLDNVAAVTNPGGVIVITDNILCEEKIPVTVRLKSAKVVEAVQFFLANYPTRKIAAEFVAPDKITIDSRDFCILLTQYNKIKKNDWDRWSVEKMEIHQYFTLSEYKAAFSKRGFETFAIVETPPDALEEWNADFEMVSGLAKLPEKRATVLARKN